MKKLLAILMMVFVASQGAFAAVLSDISGDSHEEAINYLYQQGIISGYPDGSFQPLKPVNRAELLKILVGAAGKKQVSGKNCFPDVREEWFAPYVCYAKSQGWIAGYPDGSFQPGKTVNKAETMKMVVNILDLDLASGRSAYSDVEAGSWYEGFVKSAENLRILEEPGPHFYPALLMTRGAISGIISNAIHLDKVASIPSQSGGDDGGGSSGSTGPAETTPAQTAPNETLASSDLVIWAEEGGEKVTQDELRGGDSNTVWDGEKVRIFGAKNEVVNFNLVLESPGTKTSNISVEFAQLNGPGGASIATTGSDLFDWTNRNIELFYIKYLQIKGVSAFLGGQYDQRHLPAKMQAAHDAIGIATGDWDSRANHDKYYPEIAVPLELEQGFDIQKNQNQSIWADIYIPKNTVAGIYNGTVWVKESGVAVAAIAVELEVYDFTLPDEPNSKSMVVIGEANINARYLGIDYPIEAALVTREAEIRDNHFLLAHRHKISLIDPFMNKAEDRPTDNWIPRLTGALFTAAHGYAGPGAGIGNNVYAIGLYGSWYWKDQGEAGMQENADNWESWFRANAPSVERFVYLIDESNDYAQIETWASWIENSAGVGKDLLSFATTWFGTAKDQIPSLDIAASTGSVAVTSTAQAAADYYSGRADKRLYMYNGGRPGQGSFMTDDDGVALRELAWGQYKKAVDRWFYWESTYYNNYQAGLGNTNVFRTAHTFGGDDSFDAVDGRTGWNYSNGDGVLFYPGTDMVFPQESYGLEGPIASLRLKYWRRGIEDVDYLVMAAKKNPAAVAAIVARIVPKVLWEYGVSDVNDPTWIRTEISWSDDPDVWEEARRELAEIIVGG